MRLLLFIPLLLFFSCKKDKVPASCVGITMSGERARFVGTWVWDSTLVEEWFDVGPSNYYYYTPENQGYDYEFTITDNGQYLGYKDDQLVHDFLLSGVNYQNFNGSIIDVIEFKVDCSETLFDIRQPAENVTNDSIFLISYPIKFDDEVNHLRSIRNYFVKK